MQDRAASDRESASSGRILSLYASYVSASSNRENPEKPQQHDDGDNADDDVADTLELPVHRDVIENQCDDEQYDERGDGTHRRKGKRSLYAIKTPRLGFPYTHPIDIEGVVTQFHACTPKDFTLKPTATRDCYPAKIRVV
mgnify:CR=1 FL=1